MSRSLSLLADARPYGRLASLRSHDLREDFNAWFGASGRRYVTSVFTVDDGVGEAGLPRFEAFVVVAVSRKDGRRRARLVTAIESDLQRRRALSDALAFGCNEWHVHLLGSSRCHREAIATDLRAGLLTDHEFASSA